MTLIEIMIVILLIGLIGGALAYNMRGSLDRGRVFKTEQTMARAYDVLMMKYAEGNYPDVAALLAEKTKILNNSPLLKDGDKYLKDGWGKDFVFEPDGDEIKITSVTLDQWKKDHA